ncbi:antibiotic biosynthesis monooxygenase family protein [Rubrivivax sp. RP6-9]|uniref:antibiotic biosynthesis monooxygenase family protein n=1 Tax=Rubrivivax sp. RP6-9 TaxID=3415750 RepID=UPI003CC5C398
MSLAVLFEVTPLAGCAPRYFEIAAALRPALDAIDGFLGVERFESLARPGTYLSLSWWRDEDAIRQWRNMACHRSGQHEGRAQVFAGYRIRVVATLRDYGMHDRAQAPADAGIALL